MTPTRRQTKRDIQNTPIFAPTAGARSSISPKLCMLVDNVVTILKGANHFSIQIFRSDFSCRGNNADFWPLTHWVNLIPAGCHGNLPVKRRGPKTDPCGTSNKNIISIERLPLNKTHCMDLSVRHDRIQVTVIASRPKLDCSFDSKMLWWTQSKAAPGMLTRPTWHEAKAEAEARESEADAKENFRGRGQNIWGRGRGPVL